MVGPLGDGVVALETLVVVLMKLDVPPVPVKKGVVQRSYRGKHGGEGHRFAYREGWGGESSFSSVR